MSTHCQPRNRQTGIALLEGLIAVLVFSLGILAIVGMQAVAVKQSTDARYRTEAALLAEQLIGMMWVDDRATLKTKYGTDGAGYNAWLANVSAALPKVAENPPEVDVSPEGVVTITVYWQPPGDPSTTARHQYTTTAQIN